MTTAQLRAWQREIARLEWASVLRAETVFQPRPALGVSTSSPPSTSLEEWAHPA